MPGKQASQRFGKGRAAISAARPAGTFRRFRRRRATGRVSASARAVFLAGGELELLVRLADGPWRLLKGSAE